MGKPWNVKEFCDEARTWEGTRYMPGCKLKGVGTDCGGILYELYNPYFGPFPPFPNAPPDWALHSSTERYLDFVMPFVQEVRQIAPGGFSLFHMGLAYAHAAIMLDDGYYIHAWGRLREGAVTRTKKRVMQALVKPDFPARHFIPKV